MTSNFSEQSVTKVRLAEPLYYAAHLAGTYDSAEAALSRVDGLSESAIAATIARARINTVFTAIVELGDYSAMVTQSGGQYLLWHAFTGYMGSEAHARKFISKFEGKVQGTWTVFQFTPPETSRH